MDSLRPGLVSAAFSERCACGREFYTPGAASNHTRTCKRAKARRSGALEKAKEVFRSAKRLKLSPVDPFNGATTGISESSEHDSEPRRVPVPQSDLQSPSESSLSAAVCNSESKTIAVFASNLMTFILA